MNHAFELDADDPDACRLCLLGPLAHNLRAELPDTDIRGAMAGELERMGMMPEQAATPAAAMDDEGKCGQQGRCVQDYRNCRWCPFDW